jgi:hypothetical protein
VGFGGGVSGQVVGPAWWSGGLDLYVAPFAPVGDGVAQVDGLGVVTGPVLRARIGEGAVDLGARGWVGAFAVFGRSFDVERTVVLPHASFDPELWVVPPRTPVRVGFRAEVPLTRVGLVADGQSVPTYEPAFRGGILLGLGGRLRSGEALAGGRP